jgi:hypothetical protein
VAAVLLGLLAGLCFITGGVWDVAWHIDRGRETFWSPPHLAIYGGLALGVAMPFAALRRDDAAGPTVPLLGRRLSPAALVGGVGALLAIGAGPFDEAWHQMFGLDVTIWSPPHLQLVAGATATVLGAVIELAARIKRAGPAAPPWQPLALALGFGLLLHMGIAPLGEYQFGLSRYPVYWHPILVPLAVVPVLAAAARVQEPWGATRAAVAFQLIGVMMWMVLIQAGRSATFAPLMPIAAAVAYDLLIQARRWRPEVVGAAATVALLYTQPDFLRAAAMVVWPLGRLPWIVVVAVLLGAAGAALGDRVGRALGPRGEATAAARRALPFGGLSAAAAGLVLLAVLPSVAAADSAVRVTRGVGTLSSSPMAEAIQLAGTVLVVVTVLVAAGGAALAVRAVERDGGTIRAGRGIDSRDAPEERP